MEILCGKDNNQRIGIVGSYELTRYVFAIFIHSDVFLCAAKPLRSPKAPLWARGPFDHSGHGPRKIEIQTRTKDLIKLDHFNGKGRT